MRILFIDDEKIRYDIFAKRHSDDIVTYAATIKDAQDLMRLHCGGLEFDIISFDYDMFDPELKTYLNTTGIAKWFVETCPKDKVPKFVTVHSINPQGSWHLFHILSGFTKVFLCPFRLESADEYEWAMELL